jgi:defect-in-organelle-trafficking protein DotD
MTLYQFKYHTRLAYTLGVVICCILLVSCSITSAPSTPMPPPLTTQEQIAHSATSIDQSLVSLYEVERSKKPNDLSISVEPYPEPIYPSLSRLLNVDWSGPVEPLLRDIAVLTKYRLKVMGHAPAIPVLVTVKNDRITAQELLRELRAQVYLRADILIFPDSGVIELHYLDK